MDNALRYIKYFSNNVLEHYANLPIGQVAKEKLIKTQTKCMTLEQSVENERAFIGFGLLLNS